MRRFISGLILLFLPIWSYAATTPKNSWETVLSKIAESLTGPVTYFIAIMAVFCCGMVIVFADMQSGGKRFVQAGCGIVIAAFAAKIVTGFLGVSGAVL